jgi:hypothetical protein
LAHSSQNSKQKSPAHPSWAFHLQQKENITMAKKRGFYENVKLRVQPKGKGVKLTIYLPPGDSSNLFSEIKSSVRKKQPRKTAGPKLVVKKLAA